MVMAASTAPSGANKQQWAFVTVRDLDLKARVAELVDAAGLNPAAPRGRTGSITVPGTGGRAPSLWLIPKIHREQIQSAASF